MSKQLKEWHTLEQELQDWKNEMYRRENADDFYYTQGSYREDKKHLEELELQLKNFYLTEAQDE